MSLVIDMLRGFTYLRFPGNNKPNFTNKTTPVTALHGFLGILIKVFFSSFW